MNRYCYHLFLASFFMQSACSLTEEKKVIRPVIIEINHLDEIIPINDSIVKPVLYHNISGFDSLSVSKNKEKFIAVVLPGVMIAKHKINESRKKILSLKTKAEWSEEDSLYYNTMANRFNASHLEGLLLRMHTHPVSIVIAQAAVESGWGTSRFFSKANNLFGIWSYKKDEPRIAASVRKDSNLVFLRKYDDISGSIIDYFETIARSRAYRKFRETRSKTNDINELLPYLRNYSSRRDAYVTQLKMIITQNNLTKYDSYTLDPNYFFKEM